MCFHVVSSILPFLGLSSLSEQRERNIQKETNNSKACRFLTTVAASDCQQGYNRRRSWGEQRLSVSKASLPGGSSIYFPVKRTVHLFIHCCMCSITELNSTNGSSMIVVKHRSYSSYPGLLSTNIKSIATSTRERHGIIGNYFLLMSSHGISYQ
jgi:hypothetical protein